VPAASRPNGVWPELRANRRCVGVNVCFGWVEWTSA
jgi:hypothetical protein